MSEHDLHRLRKIAALSSLADDDLVELFSRLRTRIVRSGERVCSQGDSDCSLLIVVAGRLRVVRTDELGHDRIVGEVPSGEIFGEIALITGESRSASAYAMRDTVLWVLHEDDYCRLLSNHAALARNVTRIAVQRLRESGAGVIKSPMCQTIAIATASDTTVAARFVMELIERLKSDRSVAIIDASITAQLQVEGIDTESREIALLRELDQFEKANNVAIYIADESNPDWNERCFRQADRTLLVVDAHASQPEDIGPWRTRLNNASVEVVVVRDSKSSVGDTGLLWAASKMGRATHFVQLLQEQDWRSLCHSLVDSIAAPDWLRESPLFASMSESDLRLMLAGMETISLSAREVLFEQGSASDGLFIIINGRLQATITMPTGQTRVAGTMGRGEVIGEISVLTEEPRSATVTALRDSTIAKLPLSTWKRLAASRPAWSASLAQVVVDRLSGKRQRAAAARSVCFAIQPLQKYEWLAEFVRGLEAALGRFGRCCTVDAVAVDRRFGFGAARISRGDSREAMIVDWLYRQELASDALILVCEEGDTEWTQRCLRQADQILLVASADSSPAPTLLEGTIADPANLISQTPRQLILAHPPAVSAATDTLRWLEPRSVKLHHHVRRGNADDMGRLVRLLTGRAYGLALSGGGSRGVAHIGVARALRETGIPIDVVFGASAGAALAGLIAMNVSIPAMIEKISAMLTRSMGHVTTMGPPIVSLMSGRHPIRLLQSMFGDARLEDQFIPCGIVSADLVSGEQFIHQRGLICEAARASSSLPGAWPPVIENGRVHVDGGVVNNLPIDLAQQVCPNGKVIAVDIAGNDDYSQLQSYGMELSGWSVMARQWLRGMEKARLPAMLATISRCCTLTSANRLKSLKSDSQLLLLQPPVTQYGMFEIRSEPIIRDVEMKSYEYALQALQSWKGLASHGT